MLAMMAPYWPEFLLIAGAHLVAVISPGPDFAIVLKHAISYGRRCAIFTSIGVGTAIMLHITYSLVGIGLLISQTPWLFELFKYVAAAYLVYIAYSALRSSPPASQPSSQPSSQPASQPSQSSTDNAASDAGGVEANVSDVAIGIGVGIGAQMSDKRAYWLGFLTNGLNPKATLFFLSLFSVIVAVDTPNEVKLVYGVYMSVATAAWFCLLSVMLSGRKVRQFLLQKGYWFDRLMGAILLLLAIKLVTS